MKGLPPLFLLQLVNRIDRADGIKINLNAESSRRLLGVVIEEGRWWGTSKIGSFFRTASPQVTEALTINWRWCSIAMLGR